MHEGSKHCNITSHSSISHTGMLIGGESKGEEKGVGESGAISWEAVLGASCGGCKAVLGGTV